jgi:hypothetical protein
VKDGGFRRQRRFSFGRWGLQRDISEELAFHLDMATQDLIDLGMDRTEARAMANTGSAASSLFDAGVWTSIRAALEP